jgi:hypothetical protein
MSYQLSDKLFFVRPLYILVWIRDAIELSDVVGLTKNYRYDWRGFVKAKKRRAWASRHLIPRSPIAGDKILYDEESSRYFYGA